MTYTVNIYDKTWKVASKLDLNDSVFGNTSVSKSLLHEYYLLQSSNARVAIAHTKTRGEVAGSGKKLYNQKGTGNARVWDKKSPIRRKGWVAFWPRKERNFSKAMPKRARRLALYGLLSIKAKNESILWFVDPKQKAPKTKEAVDLLNKIGINDSKVLVVLQNEDKILKRSFANIDRVKYIQLEYLNPFDIMHHDKILFTESALNQINTVTEEK